MTNEELVSRIQAGIDVAENMLTSGGRTGDLLARWPGNTANWLKRMI